MQQMLLDVHKSKISGLKITTNITIFSFPPPPRMFKPGQSGQHWYASDHLLVGIGVLCTGAQEKDFILQSGEAVTVFQNMETWITAACELLYILWLKKEWINCILCAYQDLVQQHLLIREYAFCFLFLVKVYFGILMSPITHLLFFGNYLAL